MSTKRVSTLKVLQAVPSPTGKSVGSQACIACKKRKCKCIGNPCLNCVRKGAICEFKDPKKRGPAKKLKFPKKVEECGLVCLPLINNITQQSLNMTYQAHDFIDFYFQYIGKGIPKQFKEPLLVTSEKLYNNERTTQLYIICSHIMKFFGNSELENECIHKARKHSSNIFEGDTLDAAVSLTMMAIYLGDEHPKSHSYVTMAYNITMLPSIEPTPVAIKFRYSCQARSILYNKALSRQQKFKSMEEQIFSIAQSPNLIIEVTPHEWIGIEFVRMRAKLYNMGIRCETVPDFVQSVYPVIQLVSQEEYSELKQALDKISKILIQMGQDSNVDVAQMGHSTLMVHLFRFIVEWRGGNTQAAYTAAENTMKFCKEHSNLFALWCYDNMLSLLEIPYFFQLYGAADQSQNSLQYLENSIKLLGQQGKMNGMWQEICAGSSGCNLLQIEQELMAPTPTMFDNHLLTADSNYPPQSNSLQSLILFDNVDLSCLF